MGGVPVGAGKGQVLDLPAFAILVSASGPCPLPSVVAFMHAGRAALKISAVALEAAVMEVASAITGPVMGVRMRLAMTGSAPAGYVAMAVAFVVLYVRRSCRVSNANSSVSVWRSLGHVSRFSGQEGNSDLIVCCFFSCVVRFSNRGQREEDGAIRKILENARFSIHMEFSYSSGSIILTMKFTRKVCPDLCSKHLVTETPHIVNHFGNLAPSYWLEHAGITWGNESQLKYVFVTLYIGLVMSQSHGESSWWSKMKHGPQRTEFSALLIRTAMTILPSLNPSTQRYTSASMTESE